MGRKQPFLLIGGIVGAFLLGGGLYATPYFTLYQMYQSAKSNDFQGVASHVDFPALRESVKANMKTMFAQETAKQDDPLMGILGKFLGGIVLDPVVDAVVTPEGVAALLAGQRLQIGGDHKQPTFSEKADAVDVKPHYESFNEFVVSIKPKGDDKPPVELILSRQFLDWKVSGIRLPKP